MPRGIQGSDKSVFHLFNIQERLLNDLHEEQIFPKPVERF
jgi:hypothetical protein